MQCQTLCNMYGRCLKILNTDCLSKRSRQTVDPDQTASEEAVLPVSSLFCYSDKHYVNSSPGS